MTGTALMVVDGQFDMNAAPALDEREAVRVAAAMAVGRLERLASEQVGKKADTERRWLDNLRQYHGRYDTVTETALANDATKSKLFIKLTRTKTHAWEARLTDLLFPTDDKNWGLIATPVPELSTAAREARKNMDAALAKANASIPAAAPDTAPADPAAADPAQQAPADPSAPPPPAPPAAAPAAPGPGADGMPHDQAAQAADAYAQEITRIERDLAEAQKRASAMETEIGDQLVECLYNPRARDVIHDSCLLGTGVMKGPMVANRAKKTWKQNTAEGAISWVQEDITDPSPEFVRTDPWHFFPDMSANDIRSAEFTFERYLLTRTQLKALQHQPGFDHDALRELLIENSRQQQPNYLAEMRSITGQQTNSEERWVMWEYHGSLEIEEAAALMRATGDEEGAALVEDDPLKEYRFIVFFCDNKLLKLALHPLDSGEPLYSVFNFEKDDSSIFGFGVPELMSGSQSALNGAWRMMMDNAGLSVGPQIVLNKTQVEPQNGSWAITPRKVWLQTTTTLAGQAPPFSVHTIPNNQAELANVITLARQFADDETNMPLIAQGEQASHVTPTMGGMSILMNSANVVFRRIIKNYDDDMTTPNLRRAYDWNMQFNPREDIKGDMKVDARGSSVLLVRELQATNLMNLINNWSANPNTAPMLKLAPTMRKAAQALMISAAEIIKTDDEIDQEAKRMAAQKPPPSPDEIKLQIATMDRETRLQLAQSNERIAAAQHETEMMKLAESRNMKLDELAAMLKSTKLQTDSKERIMSAEVGAQAQLQHQQKEAGSPLTGGGGYV